MTFALLLTIILVSSFGSILSLPRPGLSVDLVGEIRRADGLQLVQAAAAPRRSGDDRLEMKATDLLRSVIRIVQSYDDDDFEHLLKVIQDKIEKIDNPDKKVVELKTAILKKLKDMQAGGGAGESEAAKGVKGELGDVLTRLQDPKYEARAFKLDTTDKRASALKILTTLNDLDAYRFKSKRADISLSEAVRDGLEALAALLAARAPPTAAGSTGSPATAPAATAPPAAPAPPQTGGAPALGELVLLSLLGLPSLSKLRLQLVREKEPAAAAAPPTDLHR